MSKWIWIKFSGAVGHLVEERFVGAVKADLITRDCGELEKEEEKDAFFLDLGGAMLVGSPTETLPAISGVTVSVRSDSIGEFASRAERLQERSGGYVKLHSMYSCICMSPEQRDRLVMELRRIEEWGWARAERHYEQWKAAKS